MVEERYIGLMSGTSMDGVDGVIVEFGTQPLRVLAHEHQAFDAELQQGLMALNMSGADELHRAALAANALARCYAETTRRLLAASPGPVRAIGAHGQTVRHRPGLFDGVGYSLQINAPALLAELTGIDVVADFRSRDVAAGGQGAPLVPAFHQTVFGRAAEDLVVVNIGGIANLSVLLRDGRVRGHDCGPGNALMDGWCRRHRQVPFDDGGQWAASGQPDAGLLAAVLAHPYLALPPPKSTGRDDFHLEWLDRLLAARPAMPDAADVQATLCELTALSIARDVRQAAPDARALVVCGGGAFNVELLRRLRHSLPGVSVSTSDAHGLGALQVEAAAFAWLARAHMHRLAGNLPAATGARGPRVLGALYPAGLTTER